MGMYTELHFNSQLKTGTPVSIIEKLEYMLGKRDDDAHQIDHPLFKADRWTYMLRCDSYYFDADTHSTLRRDDINGEYYLCIRTNLKNYGNEIEKFINWVMPHLAKSAGDFLGYYRYEETEKPILIYYATDFKGGE